MTALDAYVPIVQNEVNQLAHFLNALSVDEWQRQSACDLWAIRDVVAHLIWAADFYTDTVSRGRQGDTSLPADRPPGNAPDLALMPAYFDQQAIEIRDRLGLELMPTFRSSYQTLSGLMLELSPQEWGMPCSFFRHYDGKLPARAFLFLIIQELAIHGWDIRSRFDGSASLGTDCLSLLIERTLSRFRTSGLARFPIDTKHWPLVCYRFDLRADGGLSYDMVVEGGKARMEPSKDTSADVTLYCDRATLILMMYKRLTLDSVASPERVTVEGDQALVSILDQWLSQP